MKNYLLFAKLSIYYIDRADQISEPYIALCCRAVSTKHRQVPVLMSGKNNIVLMNSIWLVDWFMHRCNR